MKGVASTTPGTELVLSRFFLFDCISIPTSSRHLISALPLDVRDLSSPSQCLGSSSTQDRPWGFCAGHSADSRCQGAISRGAGHFPGSGV